MGKEIAIKVEGISKTFRIPASPARFAVRLGLTESRRESRRAPRKNFDSAGVFQPKLHLTFI